MGKRERILVAKKYLCSGTNAALGLPRIASNRYSAHVTLQIPRYNMNLNLGLPANDRVVHHSSLPSSGAFIVLSDCYMITATLGNDTNVYIFFTM